MVCACGCECSLSTLLILCPPFLFGLASVILCLLHKVLVSPNTPAPQILTSLPSATLKLSGDCLTDTFVPADSKKGGI